MWRGRGASVGGGGRVRRSLRELDPRRWARSVRVAAGFAVIALLGAPRAVERVAAAYRTHRAEQAFDAMALPRVASELEPLHAGVRVRVSLDDVGFDARTITAALSPDLRRRVRDGVEPLWREALLVESPAVVPLAAGRLADDAQRHARLRALEDRARRIDEVFREVGLDEPGLRDRRTTTYYVDGRVPMSTVMEIIGHSRLHDFDLAVRGSRGVRVLSMPMRVCAPTPSVALEVGVTRFVLRATTERGGCTGGTRVQERVVTIGRGGSDRGMRALREALTSTPWSVTAQIASRAADEAAEAGDAAVDAEPMLTEQDDGGLRMNDEALTAALLADSGPWGEIAIRVDGDVSYADCVAVVMTARERSSDDCTAPRAGCLYPYVTLGVRR